MGESESLIDKLGEQCEGKETRKAQLKSSSSLFSFLSPFAVPLMGLV